MKVANKIEINNKGKILQFHRQNIRIRFDSQGNPWWVAKDVCKVLGYDNVSETIKRHVKERHKNTITFRDSVNRPHKRIIISESGLYSLIMQSRMPNAQEFQDWVTEKVLPQIRKTGKYASQDQESFLPRECATELRLLEMEKELKEKRTKAEAFDNLMACEGAIPMSNAAKVVSTGGIKIGRL